MDDHASGPDNTILSADGALLAMRWERGQRLELTPSRGQAAFTSVSATSPELLERGLACWPHMLFSSRRAIASGYSKPGVLSFWDTKMGQKRADLPVAGSLPLDAIAFTPDGRSLALEKSDGSVILWNGQLSKKRRAFRFPDCVCTDEEDAFGARNLSRLFAAPSANVASRH